MNGENSTNINDLPIINQVGIINNDQNNIQQNIQQNVQQNVQQNSRNLEINTINSNVENRVIEEKSTTNYNEIIGQIQQADKQGATQLPTRDIPIDTNQVTMDNEIKPNYIPPPPEDYIRNFETPEQIIKENQEQESKKELSDNIYKELQMPILVALLYFIFNLPIIKNLLFRSLPNLFNQDGNLNIYGYIFNSLVFSCLYFIVNKYIIKLFD